MAEQITLKIGSDEIGAWHFPAKGDRMGGLVVVQEIFGVTNHIRNVCTFYASQGYEVIAPCLFDRMEKSYEGTADKYKEALALSEKTDLVEVSKDLQAAIDFLKPPVFMVGYCYGGSATWVASHHCRSLTASVGYYGRLITDYIDDKPKVPIILHFGEHDDTIPMENVRQIEATHPDVPVYIYPAGHGFNSDRPTHHHKEAAELALERTLAHFRSFI